MKRTSHRAGSLSPFVFVSDREDKLWTFVNSRNLQLTSLNKVSVGVVVETHTGLQKTSHMQGLITLCNDRKMKEKQHLALFSHFF